MAITIHQEPTVPNMANANLLWLVTSTQVTQPQFQFVCDIYESGSATLLQRVKQQPNPNSKGVFDLGNILPTYLESDNVWKASPFATSSNCNIDFIVKFGEEYGTSPSSSVILYTGVATNTGDPAVTGYDFYTLTDGLVNPNEAVNFNFDSSSYYALPSASEYITYDYNHALTNFPNTQSVQEGEYHTLSFYNGNSYPESDTFAQDIFYYQITWYNSAGTSIQTDDFTNTTANGGGPRVTSTDLWGTVAGDQTNETRLIHVGVGPQNLADAGISIPATWASYKIVINGQGDDGLENNDGVFATRWFTKDTANCEYPGVRFAWKNEFGVWDYFTFKLAQSTTSGIERQEYKQTFVNFSTPDNDVNYNTERRGRNNYYNKITKTRTVESDWLTQEYADSLRELFFSTNVYVQEGTAFYPVVFTQTSVTEKTNPRTQKLFKYTAEWAYANEVRPRL